MSAELESVATNLQTLWTLMSAALVLFMQAGFCCLEAGAVRHKNSINVAVKNVVDLCVSFPAFFVIGYALMFGADRAGLFGEPRLALAGVGPQELSAFVYQAAFCSTAATIVSGGVAERCRFLPYVLVSLVISLLIYPLFGHSVWGGGLLSQLGYHDFAGSSVVHMVGAGVTLAGVQVLGPRAGRFDPDGKARPIPATSMPMVALGVVILTFGWIGFNGGSAPLGAHTATILTNTLLAACFGGLGAMLLTWAYGGLAAVELILNGVLGGLVAITACADIVTIHAATLVGLGGGMAVVLGTAMLERMRLDDAVGAVPVHGVAGLLGILMTAVLAPGEWLADAGMTRTQFLGVQAMGGGACVLWSYLTGLVAWWLVARLVPLRVGPVEETVGMNFSEHRVDSPIEALTRAVREVSEHGRDGLQARFDDVPDSQMATLAEAVRTLLARGGYAGERASQWSQDLEAISGSLDLSHRIGREAMESYRIEVDHLDRTLANIARFLARGAQDPEALQVASDSIVNLRRRLELVSHKVPVGIDSWAEIQRMTARIDLLVGHIRGDVHGTH